MVVVHGAGCSCVGHEHRPAPWRPVVRYPALPPSVLILSMEIGWAHATMGHSRFVIRGRRDMGAGEFYHVEASAWGRDAASAIQNFIRDQVKPGDCVQWLPEELTAEEVRIP